MEILEIRGNVERDLSLVIDVALLRIHYVNFESIRLSCSSSLVRRTIAIDPSKDFDYVPSSEKNLYNVTMEISKDDIEILPYEVYIQELKRSRAISFYGWNELKVLRIHECKLDELDWEIFDGLDKLQHLSLEHNGIKIVPAFTFYGVPHIKTLSLAHNVILDLNYRALAGLLELKSLDLSKNEISKMSELTFPPFPKLEIIDLRNNPIKFIFPSTFGVVNATKRLYLGHNEDEFRISGPDTFKDLIKLQHLQIMNINQSTFSQGLLKNLKNLEVVRFKGYIKYIEFDAFAEVPKLRELLLSNCHIEELSMDAFYGLSQIEIIDLSSNKLSFLPPGIFDDKSMLREINLSNNSFQRLPKNFFGSLHDNVKMVRLTDNPWICSCAFTSWKQGLINRERSTKSVSNCKINKFKNHSIHKKCGFNEYNYIYNNKMAPRCAGPTKEVNGKSIFYALRKILKCPIETKTISKAEIDLLEEKRKIRMKNKILREKEEKRIQEKLSRDKNHMKLQASMQHYASGRYAVSVNKRNSLKFVLQQTVLGNNSKDHSNNII